VDWRDEVKEMLKKRVLKEQGTIRSRYLKKLKMQKPFIKKYGKPVLVHSTYDSKVFKKILKDGELKLPKNHDLVKMTPYMGKLLGINNSIYHSLGFIYANAYGFKFSLLFDLYYLKDLRYYKNSVSYQCYKTIIDIWYKWDRHYFDKVANINKKTREVFDKYLNVSYKGKKRMLFDFWKCEKEVYEALINYRGGKKKIIGLIKKHADNLVVKYPASIRLAKKECFGEKIPEILGFKKNNLLKNPYFLGFYIEGKISREIKNILLKKYKNKILFDGQKIGIIEEIVK